ncbi:hypothetical protein [Spirosoma koreense]
MKDQEITNRIEHEAKAAQGLTHKDMTYVSEQSFPDDATAREAFERSVEKLMNVNGWSGLSSFTADFQLFDSAGQPKTGAQPQVGDSIRIELPGPLPKNWVRITDLIRDENRAEFTVHPSQDPREQGTAEVEHFFHPQASSTFRVELVGQMVRASEIGRQERINNQQPEAGDRAIINTVIAEGGWLFYQEFQWKRLTDYLVHL